MDYSEHPVFAAGKDGGSQLSIDELAQIRRLLEQLPASSRQVHVERSRIDDEELVRVAVQIVAGRREIEVQFSGQVANDPSIDLLLALFISRARGETMTISEACLTTSAPATTALRRLTILTKSGHVNRMPHRHDKRTVFVTLSDTAMATMRSWLQSVRLSQVAFA